MSDAPFKGEEPQQPLFETSPPRPEDADPMVFEDDNSDDDFRKKGSAPLKGNDKFEKLEERIRNDKYDSEAWTVRAKNKITC